MAPFRWPKIEHDSMLCAEFMEKRPIKPDEWVAVAKTLSILFSTENYQVRLTGRGCREHLDLLVKKFKANDQRALKRSGTEEELTELNEMLEDISCFLQDKLHTSNPSGSKKKKMEEDHQKGLLMRKAAMETYTKKGQDDKGDSEEEEEEEENSNEEEDDVFDEASTPSKKAKKKNPKNEQGKKARCGKGQMLEHLHKKHDDTMLLKEKKLQLEERKLALEEKKKGD